MIFSYDIKIPLSYNRYSVNEANPDREIRYELESTNYELIKVQFITYEIPGCTEGYPFNDTVVISLSQTGNQDFLCEIKGMLVDDEIYAKKFAEKIIDRICKRMSLLLCKSNADRHSFQPRIEAVWSDAIFNRCEYQPFIETRRKALETTDENNREMHIEDHLYMRDSVFISIHQKILNGQIRIKEWLFHKNEVVEFLLNEYYCALGTEKIKSKFFHLFSIIEFCEREFEEQNGASRLLDDTAVQSIINNIVFSDELKDKDKIKSMLTSNLKKANDIGRTLKLLNILKWMGITTVNQVGRDIPIDKNILDVIIKLRNKSFHGSTEDIAETENAYSDAVTKLFYIDEQILDYVISNNPFVDDENKYCLIDGKK